MIDNKYTDYANSVLTGQIITCQYTKDVCQRYLNWLTRTDIEFRSDKADSVVRFVEQLEHFQGKWAGRKFKLSDWQKFIVYYVFGFYYTGTNNRVIRHIILDCARKQGKSMFVAALSLYKLIGEKESGCECYTLANSKQQSRILFDQIKNIAKRMDPKGKHLKSNLNRVKFDKTNSYIQILASDASKLDGYSASMFCEDEFHAARDTTLYDVMLSSQGARENPLSFVVTTAGHNTLCPYYKMRQSAIDVLQGRIQNDSLVAFIYTLDEGDDWTDETVWIKSNPNLNVTVSIDYIRDRITQAKTSSLIENDVKVKTLNCWVQSVETWITDSNLTAKIEHVYLDQLKGEETYIGVDLAAVSDLTCWTALFPPSETRSFFPDKYIFKTFCYLPEQSIDNNANSANYRRYISLDELTTTPGNVTDYDYILADMMKLQNDCYIMSVAYDSWNSTQFSISATNAGLPMQPFSQSLGNFNKPTKEFERLLLSGKVIIDVSELVRWCFCNVRIKSDHNDNCKPDKQSKMQKIDCVISMLEALGAYLAKSGGFDISSLLSDVLDQSKTDSDKQ